MIPALSRGLDVLSLLGDRTEPLSLEELSRMTEIPKASLLRIMETLEGKGLVNRDSDKRYRALSRLVRSRPERDFRLREILKDLALRSEAISEWYMPNKLGCVMTDQSNPPRYEIILTARPGFLRAWKGELDSVAQIGYALAPELSGPWTELNWCYNRWGRSEGVDKARFDSLMADIRGGNVARDININPHGVTRMAMGALDGKGRLAGILALAFISGPRLDNQQKRGEELLKEYIKREIKL